MEERPSGIGNSEHVQRFGAQAPQPGPGGQPPRPQPAPAPRPAPMPGAPAPRPAPAPMPAPRPPAPRPVGGGGGGTPAEIQMVSETTKNLPQEGSKAVIGKQEVLTNVAIGLLANGHILFEDFPGLAKTLMANTFARALGATFRRIQFTPDLLPTDITGTYVYDEKDNEFKFRQGPIFTNILLADEINRAPPKTQAALLEAMQERQVTIEGVTHILPKPFLVMATQNPIEQEGTYALPER